MVSGLVGSGLGYAVFQLVSDPPGIAPAIDISGPRLVLSTTGCASTSASVSMAAAIGSGSVSGLVESASRVRCLPTDLGTAGIAPDVVNDGPGPFSAVRILMARVWRLASTAPEKARSLVTRCRRVCATDRGRREVWCRPIVTPSCHPSGHSTATTPLTGGAGCRSRPPPAARPVRSTPFPTWPAASARGTSTGRSGIGCGGRRWLRPCGPRGRRRRSPW